MTGNEPDDDVFLLMRNELDLTPTPECGKSDVELLYLALDERFLPRTLYRGITCNYNVYSIIFEIMSIKIINKVLVDISLVLLLPYLPINLIQLPLGPHLHLS